MNAPLALELSGVHKRFVAVEAVRGVSLSIRAGERVALIGPNGAGKTTLFNCISGALRPDRGQIQLHEARIDGLAAHRIYRRGLARSFQVSSLFDGLSVIDNLRCAILWSQGMGHAFWTLLDRAHGLTARCEELLDQLGLSGRRDTLASALSYAEQRSLEIGLAVAGGAHTLLLDEPTAGMSRSETLRTVDLIRSLSEGRTLLMVEHDMSVVFDLADRVAVMVAGELIAFDTPQAIRRDARVQQAYLGGLAEIDAVAHD